jgi:hypothetical protein
MVERGGRDAERERPEFGPRGYLPDRAARRARKIVLREPMGLGWPVAAVIAGVLVAAVGLAYLLARTLAPAPPFVPVGELERIPRPGAVVAEVEGSADAVLVVRVTGSPRGFIAPPEEVAYCPASRRLEAPASGSVWRLDGQRVGGRADSLPPVELRLHDGTLYVNPVAAGEPIPPSAARETPACTPGASAG